MGPDRRRPRFAARVNTVMFTPELDTNKEHDPDDVAQLCCLPGREPRVVLPDWERRPASYQIDKAKVICRRCEVADTCLRWAIESRQDDGVWGGLSTDERRALKRRIARARPLSRVASDLR